jgi:hypothetical protein
VLALADRVLVIEGGHLKNDFSHEEFRQYLQTDSRLIVRLSPDDMINALTVLERIGTPATGNGAVLTMSIGPGRKAEVLTALIQSGIDVEDFELEFGYGYRNR